MLLRFALAMITLTIFAADSEACFRLRERAERTVTRTRTVVQKARVLPLRVLHLVGPQCSASGCPLVAPAPKAAVIPPPKVETPKKK